MDSSRHARSKPVYALPGSGVRSISATEVGSGTMPPMLLRPSDGPVGLNRHSAMTECTPPAVDTSESGAGRARGLLVVEERRREAVLVDRLEADHYLRRDGESDRFASDLV